MYKRMKSRSSSAPTNAVNTDSARCQWRARVATVGEEAALMSLQRQNKILLDQTMTSVPRRLSTFEPPAFIVRCDALETWLTLSAGLTGSSILDLDECPDT